MYIPMLLGMVLFSYNVVNIFSSLLLFFGGYIAIKNTFDYRCIRKNIDSVNNELKKDNSNFSQIVRVRRVGSKNKVKVRKKMRY